MVYGGYNYSLVYKRAHDYRAPQSTGIATGIAFPVGVGKPMVRFGQIWCQFSTPRIGMSPCHDVQDRKPLLSDQSSNRYLANLWIGLGVSIVMGEM